MNLDEEISEYHEKVTKACYIRAFVINIVVVVGVIVILAGFLFKLNDVRDFDNQLYYHFVPAAWI